MLRGDRRFGVVLVFFGYSFWSWVSGVDQVFFCPISGFGSIGFEFGCFVVFQQNIGRRSGSLSRSRSRSVRARYRSRGRFDRSRSVSWEDRRPRGRSIESREGGRRWVSNDDSSRSRSTSRSYSRSMCRSYVSRSRSMSRSISEKFDSRSCSRSSRRSASVRPRSHSLSSGRGEDFWRNLEDSPFGDADQLFAFVYAFVDQTLDDPEIWTWDDRLAEIPKMRDYMVDAGCNMDDINEFCLRFLGQSYDNSIRVG